MIVSIFSTLIVSHAGSVGRIPAGSGFVKSDVLVDVWGSSAILIDRVAVGWCFAQSPTGRLALLSVRQLLNRASIGSRSVVRELRIERWRFEKAEAHWNRL